MDTLFASWTQHIETIHKRHRHQLNRKVNTADRFHVRVKVKKHVSCSKRRCDQGRDASHASERTESTARDGYATYII